MAKTTRFESPASPRRRRRLLIGLIAATGVVAALVVALPWLASSRAGRDWLLGKADRALAPARFSVSGLRFSWFGPTRMTDFTLFDKSGDRVVHAPRAVWDRTFVQVLFRRPRLGTLRLEGATIDAERDERGTIDLEETLRPILGLNDRTSLRIEIPDGRLRVRGAGILKPIEAERAMVEIRIAPAPEPITWVVRLRNEAPRQSLSVEGELGGAGGRGRGASKTPDLRVKVEGMHWPWAVGGGGVRASGVWDGAVAVTREGGLWESSGTTSLPAFDAEGPWLLGDTLSLAGTSGRWDVRESGGGWSIRGFEVTSPIGKLTGGGEVSRERPEAGTGRIEGSIDLAALAARLPHALRLREGMAVDRGKATIRVETLPGDGGVLDVSARVDEIRARGPGSTFHQREPATFAARFRRPGGVLAVERFSVEAPSLRGTAEGNLADGVKLRATLDLAGMQRQLRELVDLGAAEVSGLASLSGDYRAVDGKFHGGFDAEVRMLKVVGASPMALDRESVALHGAIDGAASGSGMPTGWENWSARLRSGEVAAEVKAEAAGPHLAGSFTGPWTVFETKARAVGAFEARWDGEGVRLDPVRVSVEPTGEGGRPAIRLGAVGRYQKGELVLRPSGEGAGVIGLGAEGVRISGIGGGGFRVEGSLAGDLEAARAWGLGGPDGLRGGWTARATGGPEDEGFQIAARVDVDRLGWGPRVAGERGEKVGLAARMLVPTGGSRVDLAELTLTSRFATLDAHGMLDDPAGGRVVDVRGTFAPDWGQLNEWLAANVDPGSKVAGRSHAFHVRTSLHRPISRPDEAELGVTLDGADVYGLKVGPVALTMRAKAGAWTIDPIDTRVNRGSLHLNPALRTEPTAAILLGEGSALDGAEVNDEVSRRVLAFVAPVLNNATRVRGRVSARVDSAVFPLDPSERGSAVVDGEVVFKEVEFVPGPLTEQLFALAGRSDQAVWRLDEPVSLTIADRRVNQKGLTIPVGKLSKIEVEGWVDFDRNLNLTASLPVLPGNLGDRPILGDIAGASRVRVPIRGTLSRPEIDKEAFNLGMKATGRELLERGAVRGASELILRMLNGRPRDPDAPAPAAPSLTPAERRARRQQLREERREQRRGLPPGD